MTEVTPELSERVSWELPVLGAVAARTAVLVRPDGYAAWVVALSARMHGVLEMLRDLVAHKGYANAALLNVIRQNEAATGDPELSELLHHILLANRFWLLTVLGLPFALEDESRPSTSFDALTERLRGTQVCLHSHGHRAQCAKLLRRHGVYRR